MLKGKLITLRLIRESDLADLYKFHTDIQSRGEYFPVGVISEPKFRERYAENGFWDKEEGMLLIADLEDKIIGHIEFFRTVLYLDEFELSYQIYSKDYSGKGIATESVNLLTGYIFNNKKINRIRLIIHPDNIASIKVADKCGYYHESTAREIWFHKGSYNDVEVYVMLRDQFNDLNKNG